MLWEHAAPTNKQDHNAWKESFKELCHFKTVEQFWQYYNHIPKPSNVFFTMGEGRKCFPNSGGKTVEEYSLFKKGIEPEWGDPQNRIGGEFFCRGNMDPDQLNAYWHNLVLAVVGEYLEGLLCTCGGCADVTNETQKCVDRECSCKSIVNGIRVVDKSKHYPVYKLELWVNTKDPVIKERLRTKLMDVVMEGISNGKKLQFEWKDHKV